MTVKSRRGAGAALAAVGVGLLAATLGSGAAVRAQETGIASYPSHPFSIRAGLFLPNNGQVRDSLGIDWLSYGASYDFRTAGTKLPQTYSVYADYYDETKTTGPSDFRLRSEAVVQGYGIADRYYFVPKMEPFQPYVGGAFGIYNARAKRLDPGGYASEYKTSIGGKILAGAEIKEGIFAEASYSWLPEPKLVNARVKLSGYQLQLGYRF